MADDRRQLEKHLSSLVAEFGRRLLRDPQQVAASVGDVAPGRRAERRALEAAAEAGVADALLDISDRGMLPDDSRGQVSQRLADTAGLPPELAAWAVDAFAHALQLSPRADPAPQQILPGGCVVTDPDPTTPTPSRTPAPPDWLGPNGALSGERPGPDASEQAQPTEPTDDTRPLPGGRGPGSNDGEGSSTEKWRTRHRKALLGAGSLAAVMLLVLTVVTGVRSWQARAAAAIGEELVPGAACRGETSEYYEGWGADCRTTVGDRPVQVTVPVDAIEETEGATSAAEGSPTTAERDCAAGDLPLDADRSDGRAKYYELDGAASFGRITCSFFDFESGPFLIIELHVEGVGPPNDPIRLDAYGVGLDNFPDYAPLWQEVVDRVLARLS